MDVNAFTHLFCSRIQDTEALVEATNKSSVLVIQQFPVPTDGTTLVPHVRESISNVLAFVELGDVPILRSCLNLADGVFDIIIMDADLKLPQSAELISLTRATVGRSQLFYFCDNSVWAGAGIGIIQVIERDLFGKQVLLTGNGILTTHLSLGLIQAGATVYRPDDASPRMLLTNRAAFSEVETIERIHEGFNYSNIDLVVGGAVKEQTIDRELCERVRNGIRLYDIGIGNLSEEAVLLAREKGCDVYRLDNRAGISAMVLGQMEADYLVKNVMGKVNIKSVEIVAGGIMGRSGAIIVDNIRDPGYVIGVANGRGRIKHRPETDDEQKDLDFVQRLITKW